ncbi:hypothetical protein PVAND_001377 [Polypedilum vanderplanki]|uniref:Uncharacterized protein n=1 Tax=Polypedilum vanderplanki TaxID=319348 RepID=A0A9J6BN81_POLVA|nr:hypothetical protein PVAND_001377 [Polypedilum vanderplanki]
MNRERDSEIIHDLVTSKYKIAERNRLAKIKFLSNMSVDKVNDGKRRDSEPSLAQTERVEVRPVDLSVPGTPVSSHYLASLRKLNRNRNDIETDSEDEDEDNANHNQRSFTQELQDGLKQFTSNMEKLQQQEDSSSHDTKKEETTEEITVKKEPALSRVEQYFRDSARRGSLTRDFSEVVQQFDPKLLQENGNSSSHVKPGTPVSSKLIKAEKKSSTKLGTFDMKKLETLKSPEVVKQASEKLKTPEIAAPEKPKRMNPVPLTPTVVPATSVAFNKEDFPPVSSSSISTNEKKELPAIDKKNFPPVSSSTISAIDKTDFSAVSSAALIEAEKKDFEAVEEKKDSKAKEKQVSTVIDKKDFPPVSSSTFIAAEKKEIPTVDKKDLTAIENQDFTASKKKDFSQVSSQTDSTPRSPSNESTSSDSSSMVVIDKKDFPSISSNNNNQHIEPIIEIKSMPTKSQSNEIKPTTFISTATIITNGNEEKQQKSKKAMKRTESNVSISSNRSDVSVPGTPVDSRRLFSNKTAEDFSDDDSDMEIIDSSEVKALAQEFVDKIETLVQKTMEDEQIAINKKDDDEEKQGEHKLLIIYDDISNNKVKEYFDQSEKEKSYQRTFSEVESFNVPSEEVKEKVEKFFKESEEKKSLTRGFSEAVNYIEPVDIEKLFKPGTPVSSQTVATLKKEILGDEIIEEEREIDPVKLKQMEAFQKAHEALHPVDFKVDEYFEQSKERQTLKRDFSEVYGEIGGKKEVPKEITNPNIQKFFEESDAQKTFRRQFSEAFQTLPPRIKDILVEQQLEQPKSGRSTSIFSAPPDCSDNLGHHVSKKSGKKYGIDKYFATSLYRTAYHRNNADRRGSEPNHRLAILEDEYVFGETDALRSEVFQDDDSTPIRNTDDGDYEQQNVQFWRDFLKPYTLNLPTDIVMRDELIDKYTKYTLE